MSDDVPDAQLHAIADAIQQAYRATMDDNPEAIVTKWMVAAQVMTPDGKHDSVWIHDVTTTTGVDLNGLAWMVLNRHQYRNN